MNKDALNEKQINHPFGGILNYCMHVLSNGMICEII